jgi:hypothetical protein
MFIEEYPGLVDPAVCEAIIAKFEQDPARKPSEIVTGGYSTKHQMRTGTTLFFDPQGEWKPLMEQVNPALKTALKRYAATYPAMVNMLKLEVVNCGGPIVERVNPGQGFDWHCDQGSNVMDRVLTSLLYLRTVEHGGTTEFLQQARHIKPEAGKIAMFPAFWTHMHRGVPPVSETKYAMSFFWSYGAPQKK